MTITARHAGKSGAAAPARLIETHLEILNRDRASFDVLREFGFSVSNVPGRTLERTPGRLVLKINYDLIIIGEVQEPRAPRNDTEDFFGTFSTIFSSSDNLFAATINSALNFRI